MYRGAKAVDGGQGGAKGKVWGGCREVKRNRTKLGKRKRTDRIREKERNWREYHTHYERARAWNQQGPEQTIQCLSLWLGRQIKLLRLTHQNEHNLSLGPVYTTRCISPSVSTPSGIDSICLHRSSSCRDKESRSKQGRCMFVVASLECSCLVDKVWRFGTSTTL